MNLSYYLIQYMEDPFKYEGRNVGIVAYGKDRSYFRALGVDFDGSVDSGCFENLSPHARANGWAYREWANWFLSLVKNEGRSPENLERILADLELNGHNIVARRGGLVEVPAGETAIQTVRELFEALVTKPPGPKVSVFDNYLRETMEKSELSSRADFEKDVEVKFDAFAGRPPVVVQFPFLLTGPPRTAFKVVRFHSGKASFIKGVNDALFTFEKSIERGFVVKDRCVILTEPAPRDKSPYLERLSDFAHIVNVTSSEAASAIRSIVATGRPS